MKLLTGFPAELVDPLLFRKIVYGLKRHDERVAKYQEERQAMNQAAMQGTKLLQKSAKGNCVK